MFVLGSGCWPLPRPELTVVQPLFRAACKTSGHGDRGRDTSRASDTSCGTESAGKYGRPFAAGRRLTLGEDSPARANESRQHERAVGVGKQHERLIGGNKEPRRDNRIVKANPEEAEGEEPPGPAPSVTQSEARDHANCYRGRYDVDSADRAEQLHPAWCIGSSRPQTRIRKVKRSQPGPPG
jgi:hypothetical protein